jgi:hypothetical protein
MRFPAALGAALPWLFLAELASAQPPPDSAAPAKDPAPAAPEPAPSAAPTTATTSPSGPALVIVPAESDQPQLEPVPSAHDTLGGHFVLGAAVGAKWPFGSLSDGTKQDQELGAGLALNLDLGVGLSRNVVIGVWGELDDYASPAKAATCAACSARSFAGGPFIRYHIVQGTRFDPWGAIALGLRQTTVDHDNFSVRNADQATGVATTTHFVGPDWLRLTLGGDWYPLANVGVGPYVEFDVGAYNRHPHSSTVGTEIHTGLGTGLRLTLDFPGK